jgi:hypothetical protein
MIILVIKIFQYDNPGPNCISIENGDLDDNEIEWILEHHNFFRNKIARDMKKQNLRLPARDMLQVVMFLRQCC